MRIDRDIYKYPHGKYRARVRRRYTTFYLGMFETEEMAKKARDDFLISIDNGKLVKPVFHSKDWFVEESRNQRNDFAQRYSRM